MENISSNDTLSSSESDVCWSDKSFRVFISLVVIFSFLIGQPVIAKILWLTFTSKKAPDILNCNLAVFNNLHQFISILHLIVLFSKPRVHERLLTFSLAFGQIGGPINFFCICIERYVAVLYPMSYPLLKKYRFREISVVVIWCFSVIVSFMCVLYDMSSVEDETPHLLPLCVLGVMVGMMWRCSIRIARSLRKSGPGTEKLHPAKRKAFKIVCATSGIAVFCYTPVSFLQRLLMVHEDTSHCTVKALCAMFLSIESVVHPLFYLSTQVRLCACFKVKRFTFTSKVTVTKCDSIK